MKKVLVGRDKERKLLDDYATKKGSYFIAIVGRRRIGKTFLIKETIGKRMDFEMIGLQHATKQAQLQVFFMTLAKYTDARIVTQLPKSWSEAFHQLRIYLQSKKSSEKKIIFFDELPWIASNKSGFVEALAHFWNDWACENNVLLITCGSATSWMLNNIVNNKGGLHNRIHHTIRLGEFTMSETKKMLAIKRIKASYQQIAELHMIMGGVPYYLSLIERGPSIIQNIDNLFFASHGNLNKEHENLLPSLFGIKSNHEKIIEILAMKRYGLTRAEITAYYPKGDGGGLSTVLEELMLSGLIQKFQPYQKSVKDTIYRLTDAYLLFYYNFLKKHKDGLSFIDIQKTQRYKIWRGYAFENVCATHIKQIKKILGIDRIVTTQSSLYVKGNEELEGMQVDLLIERADGIITLCEMKFHIAQFSIDKKYYMHLKNRIAQVEKLIKYNKQIQLVFITANGLVQNEYSNELVDEAIEISELIE